ncbi:MAG: carbon monoxide dehydrogenase subunit G [Sphingomonadales bacterium]
MPADREEVWHMLQSLEVLKASIPGCEDLVWENETTLRTIVRAKVGPIKARLKSKIVLSNINPPESYTIAGEGQGGVSRFAKGKADVTLVETPEGCELSYSASANVGGKLAQMGSRLLNSVAKKMADDFFDGFAAHFTKSMK